MANFLGANDDLSLEKNQLTGFPNRRMHLRYEVEKEIEYSVHDYAGKIFRGIIILVIQGLACLYLPPYMKARK